MRNICSTLFDVLLFWMTVNYRKRREFKPWTSPQWSCQESNLCVAPGQEAVLQGRRKENFTCESTWTSLLLFRVVSKYKYDVSALLVDLKGEKDKRYNSVSCLYPLSSPLKLTLDNEKKTKKKKHSPLKTKAIRVGNLYFPTSQDLREAYTVLTRKSRWLWLQVMRNVWRNRDPKWCKTQVRRGNWLRKNLTRAAL